jgi:hypothetical protein
MEEAMEASRIYFVIVSGDSSRYWNEETSPTHWTDLENAHKFEGIGARKKAQKMIKQKHGQWSPSVNPKVVAVMISVAVLPE